MSSWLPDQITRPQPYSMTPVLRWAGLPGAPDLPPVTTMRMDRAGAERDILTCLVAPRVVQKSARSQGVRAVILIRPKGIEKVNPKLTSTEQLLREEEFLLRAMSRSQQPTKVLP